MGPGYFPIVLGSLLILFGLYIAATGLRADSERLGGSWLPRALVAAPLLVTLIAVMIGLKTFTMAAIALAFGTALATAPLLRALRDTKEGEADTGDQSLAGAWSPRALILLPLSLVLFGLLIDRAGFIPAMLVLLVGSATAGREFKLIEVVLFSVFMTALCAIVFVWALGLPYPLIVGF
jgi:hypothetical protein